jgi:AraC-like DNA-binding protein
MGIFNSLSKRKYLLQVYTFVSVIILALMLTFSSVIYFRMEKSLVDEEISNGKKILIQMRNNIQNINDIVRNICLTNYYSNDISGLLFLKEKDSFVEINAQQKLVKSVIATNFFIHSVYIYNNNRKIYFSTSDPFYHEDKLLEKKLESRQPVPVLKPVLRNIEMVDAKGNKTIEQVFTYFYYEQTDQQGRMDGAVIVNIKLDWIYNSIKEISAVDNGKNNQIVLVNEEGELVSEKGREESLRADTKAYLTDYVKMAVKTDDNSVGMGTKLVNGKKILFTYAKMQDSNWVLFKIRAYDDIYRAMDSLRILFILMTVGFLILGLAAATIISRFIYKPIAGILHEVKNSSQLLEQFEDEKMDEISMIKDTIRSSMEKLEKLHSEKTTNSRIVKSYFLMRLLTESSMIKQEELISGFNEYGILLKPENSFAVCVFKIDRYQIFLKKNNELDRMLYRSAASNIILKIISASYPCEVLDTQEDRITAIINVPVPEQELYLILKQYLEQINEHIQHDYNFSFSVSVSEVTDSYTNISRMNQRATTNLMYRYVLGLGCLITPEKVAHNSQNLGENINFEHEASILEMVRKGDVQLAEKRLSTLFSELKGVNYADVMTYSMHLANALRNLIIEINENRQEPVNISGMFSVESLQELETLDELHRKILDILSELELNLDDGVNEKHRMLAGTIKDIIDANYQNTQLNASFIADMLKLSLTHIGKTFNDCMKMSIPEYVNEVRLKKAVEWLQNSRLSINEVMQRVGVENQSYFYRIFKKKYGKSPREYIHQ